MIRDAKPGPRLMVGAALVGTLCAMIVMAYVLKAMTALLDGDGITGPEIMHGVMTFAFLALAAPLGILFWPMSVALAAALLLAASLTLGGANARQPLSRMSWLAAGTMIGTLVAMAMRWEDGGMTLPPRQSPYRLEELLLAGALAGALAMLATRHVIRRFSS